MTGKFGKVAAAYMDPISTTDPHHQCLRTFVAMVAAAGGEVEVSDAYRAYAEHEYQLIITERSDGTTVYSTRRKS